MTESLWDLTTRRLLRDTSSGDPTPGGGSVAAVSAAFGMGLVVMAIEVTLAGPDAGDATSALTGARDRVQALQADAVHAADRDVAQFDALMAGYRLPRGTDAEQEARREAIDQATVTATHGPLELAESAVAAMALADEIEASVKPTIVSDVQAGRDLLEGAARAALRTADINLTALEQRAHPEAQALRTRREAVHRAVLDGERSA